MKLRKYVRFVCLVVAIIIAAMAPVLAAPTKQTHSSNERCIGRYKVGIKYKNSTCYIKYNKAPIKYIETCQLICKKTEWCKFFTYIYGEKICCMSKDNVTTITLDDANISGPKNACNPRNAIVEIVSNVKNTMDEILSKLQNIIITEVNDNDNEIDDDNESVVKMLVTATQLTQYLEYNCKTKSGKCVANIIKSFVQSLLKTSADVIKKGIIRVSVLMEFIKQKSKVDAVSSAIIKIYAVQEQTPVEILVETPTTVPGPILPNDGVVIVDAAATSRDDAVSSDEDEVQPEDSEITSGDNGIATLGDGAVLDNAVATSRDDSVSSDEDEDQPEDAEITSGDNGIASGYTGGQDYDGISDDGVVLVDAVVISRDDAVSSDEDEVQPEDAEITSGDNGIATLGHGVVLDDVVATSKDDAVGSDEDEVQPEDAKITSGDNRIASGYDGEWHLRGTRRRDRAHKKGHGRQDSMPENLRRHEFAAVDGAWSEWSNCHGKAICAKIRSCSKPTPTNGGKMCDGDFIEFCEKRKCTVFSGAAESGGEPTIQSAAASGGEPSIQSAAQLEKCVGSYENGAKYKKSNDCIRTLWEGSLLDRAKKCQQRCQTLWNCKYWVMAENNLCCKSLTNINENTGKDERYIAGARNACPTS